MAKRNRLSRSALTAIFILGIGGAGWARESGTKQELLAGIGEVHDGVLAALERDSRYSIKDGADRIEARLDGADKPYVLVAVIRRASNEQSELEVIYEAPQASSDEKARFEQDFLQQVTEAIKYAETGYNRAPDLKSPLDEGPRVDPAPSIPAVDSIRRY